MVNQNKMVNLGHCQGIVVGEVFSPYPNIAILNVRVKSDRKNPETKKHEMHLINFVLVKQIVSLLRRNIYYRYLCSIYLS